MSDCIFCKIIEGIVPAAKVYEDAHVVAFLDISPVHKGHTLVVPKKHAVNVFDMDEATLVQVACAAQKVARAVKEGTGADAVNVSSNNGAASGQQVMHAHWHVIPRFAQDGLKHWPQGRYAEGEIELYKSQIEAFLKA